MQPDGGAGTALLRAAFDGVSALDLLRCQSLTSPPRGLLLELSCGGGLLDLADSVCSGEGCRKLLQGESAKPMRGRRAGGGACAGTLWEQLERFDAGRVSARQAATVKRCVKDDAGGLMEPHHMENVNRGARALARWLQLAMGALDDLAPAPPDADRPSAAPPRAASGLPEGALFAPPPLARCSVCGARVAPELVIEHEELCRRRQAAAAVDEWRAEQALDAERLAAARRGAAVEEAARARDKLQHAHCVGAASARRERAVRDLARENEPPPPPPPPPRAPPPRTCSGSPTRGWPTKAGGMRIWCGRPVAICTWWGGFWLLACGMAR